MLIIFYSTTILDLYATTQKIAAIQTNLVENYDVFCLKVVHVILRSVKSNGIDLMAHLDTQNFRFDVLFFAETRRNEKNDKYFFFR